MTSFQERSWFERNPWKTVISFVTLSLVFIIFLVEFVLGVKPSNDYFKLYRSERNIKLSEYSPFMTRAVIPPEDYMRKVDNLVQKEYAVRTDSSSFIISIGNHENPDLTLVFLGGSTTECLFVNEENRFPGLVARLIEEESEIEINSFNSGVSGNNSMQSIHLLLGKIIPMKPDYVILKHTCNDLSTLLYLKEYWNIHRNKSLIVTKSKSPNPKAFMIGNLKKLTKTIIPNIYSRIRNTLLKKKNADDEWAEYRDKKRLVYDENLILSSFTKSLKTFISICRIWDIKPVLMTQSNRLTSSPDMIVEKWLEGLYSVGITYEEIKHLTEEMNRIVRTTAIRNEVLLIDLEKLVPKEPKYMYDLVHYNDTGSIFVSKIISRNILDEINKEAE